MSQSYFNSRKATASPTPEKEAISPGFAPSHASDVVSRAEDVQEAYVAQKNRLVSAIDATRSLLSDLRTFNKESWVVRYPQLTPLPATHDAPAPGMRRSLSFADEPDSATEVVITRSKRGMQRSVTLANISEAKEAQAQEEQDEADVTSEFNILQLDLKLGPTASPAALVSQLEKASIANLIDERVQAAMRHIDKIRLRVEDTSSKVLVTGDLNAGKSTLVNALLRQEVMPVDQQPMTTLFCEVLDAQANKGMEEVHVVKDNCTYALDDETTYTRHPISALEELVSESDAQHMLKVYIADQRPQTESLLNNGVVDIALIDAPGLNVDIVKTTSVFARQEEIDVVVFVVSAENHLTQSAKEFLRTASNEKAYLFIVVNRFDKIVDKERCKRLVLQQIKQLSPRTWDDADDLVHFVDSSASVAPNAINPTFDKLESALRSFVLVKRAKSKLHPASTYLTKLLGDIDLLSSANAIVAQSERERALADLERALPILEKMKSGREDLEDGLENVEDARTTAVGNRAREILNNALERVGDGQVALPGKIAMPTYPGLLNIWEYVQEVRRALLTSIDLAVKLAEDDARVATSAGVREVAALGERHLPEGVERSKRVFMPEAMFAPRARPGKAPRRISGTAVVQGLGLGLAQRADLLEVSFADILDLQYLVAHHFGSGHSNDKQVATVDEDTALSALGIVSVGVGALTMASGKALGARGLLEGVVRISDLLGNESARRWAAPVLGAAVLALTGYFVLELPNSVPRTVGRRVRAELLGGEQPFVGTQAQRVERETRKVLRLASWDLRERFRGAMEERGREVRAAEEMQKRAEGALEWFAAVAARTLDVRDLAGLDA